MFCPIESKEIGWAQCPVRCMYNQEGKCRYAVMNGVESQEDRMSILKMQGYDEEKIETVASKVKAYLYTNEYCQYLIGVGLLEITNDQIDVVLKSEEQHSKWIKAGSNRFKAVVRVLNHILENRS